MHAVSTSRASDVETIVHEQPRCSPASNRRGTRRELVKHSRAQRLLPNLHKRELGRYRAFNQL